jgi:hypothetical protein
MIIEKRKRGEEKTREIYPPGANIFKSEARKPSLKAEKLL